MRVCISNNLGGDVSPPSIAIFMKSNIEEIRIILEQLNHTHLHSILLFARFLLNQQQNISSDTVNDNRNNKPVQPESIKDIHPPKDEKVVAAIKRLSASYYMLDKKKILDKAAKIVSDHMLNGKSREDAIDEMEDLFAKHYDLYCQSYLNDD